MQGVNMGFMCAFVCALAVVAVLLVGVWKVALVALAAAVGYATYRFDLPERWHSMKRRRD